MALRPSGPTVIQPRASQPVGWPRRCKEWTFWLGTVAERHESGRATRGTHRELLVNKESEVLDENRDNRSRRGHAGAVRPFARRAGGTNRHWAGRPNHYRAAWVQA